MINFKTRLYASKRLISLGALVLVFVAVITPLAFKSPAYAINRALSTTDDLQHGYEITVDGEAVCIVKDKGEASSLVEDLLTKAKNYYLADKSYSPVNEIEINESLFSEEQFADEEKSKSSMGVDVIFGAPVVTAISGKEITISLSETVISEKLVETQFQVEYQYTYGVSSTYEKVLTEGKNGVIKQFYEAKEINGRTISEKLIFENVLSEPETMVVEIGVTPSMQLASSELAFFIMPYDGRISSDYGYRYLDGLEFHTGVDLVAKSGSCYGKTAVAAADGTVIESGYSSSRGNYVIIQHEFGFKTIYMHFKTRLVSKGDVVKAGDPVGLIGSTGRSTGAHLHFEIRLNNKHVDPENYLNFK